MDELRNHLDTWAVAWWGWMIQSSWQVALLALLVWGLSRLARNSSASFRCTLWLLVFVKLMLPPGLTAPWSVGTAAQHAAKASGYDEIPFVSTNSGLGVTTNSVASSEGGAHGIDSVSGSMHATPIPLETLLLVLWLAVVAGMFTVIAFQYLRFRKRAIWDSDEAPKWVRELVACQAKDVGLARAPRVRVTRRGGVPSVFGTFRPLVLLPKGWLDSFDSADLARVVTHELAHVKRGDLAVGWLTACLTCCYWFHPLVWVAHRHLRREREMACDDMVLRRTETDGKDYAGTILKGAEFSDGEVPAGAGFLGLMEVSENLLYRIRSAGDEARKRQMGLRSVLVLGLMAVALFPMQAVSRGEEDAELSGRKGELALYKRAHPEVQAFIKNTCKSFGRSNLWLDVGALDDLTSEARASKIAFIAGVLEGEYGRHQCESLAEAGVLHDPRLLPGLKKVASYHRDDRDYDCRAKWMAVAALGRQNDKLAVPVLIPLVDHGNLNTRMWARGSLTRLTGQTFQDDKKAWGAWWNALGKEPQLSEEDLAPWTPPEGVAKATAPEIVSITPAIGASEVDPALTTITVTFDQDMGILYSWTGGGETFPETTGMARWKTKRICELPVTLQEGRVYRLGINSKSYHDFRGANGLPARNRVLYFATVGADPAVLAAVSPPMIISKVVSPNRAALVVTFDRPMSDGASWIQVGGNFPETTGGMQWSNDGRSCMLPVRLQVGQTYRVGLNSEQYKNFRSASGEPSEPVVWEFTVE